jgi:hypothetical protein
VVDKRDVTSDTAAGTLPPTETAQPPVARRWAGVGSCDSTDSSVAGRVAAAQALAGRSAVLVVVFASDDHELDALVAGVRAECGDAVVVGCTTAGEIWGGRAGTNGSVIFALGGAGIRASAGVARQVSRDLRAGGAEAACAALADQSGTHQVLMLLTDGLAGDQSEVVRGAYHEAGAAIPLVGGCAGDDLRMARTRQIFGAEVLEDSIIAVCISSEAPLGIGVSHGWRKVGEPLVVTAASGTRVRSLDGRPALDVYLERLNPPLEAWSDHAAFTHFAQTHPLGLDRRTGVSIRFVGGADFRSRELICIAQVPEDGFAYLMEGDSGSVLDATDVAARQALDALEGQRPLGLLAFDCIARRGVLGDAGIAGEAGRLTQIAPDAAIAGFYTYGEFARTQGMTGFHNQTLVVLALA